MKMGATNPVIPLTDEQRQFAAKNEHLIWSFIRWKNLGFGELEMINDWYGILVEAYLNAVKDYSHSGKFKTFAYAVMRCKVASYMRYNSWLKRKGTTLSLDAPVVFDSDITLEEIVADRGETVEDIVVAQVSKDDLWMQIQSVLLNEQLEAVRLRLLFDGDLKSAAIYAKVNYNTFCRRLHLARNHIAGKIMNQKKTLSKAEREKLAAKKRAYREANKEKEKAQRRARYDANKEKVAAQKKAYYQANKEKIAAQNKVRHEKKKALLEQQFQQGA